MSRRPCNIEWVQDILRQCQTTGTPFFLKQLAVNGKMDKSSMLGGKQWREFPDPFLIRRPRVMRTSLLTKPTKKPQPAEQPRAAAPEPIPVPMLPSSPPPPLVSPSSTFTLMSNVVAKPVQWLWPQHVPLGEMTIFDGDPATNKSSLVLDLAARVSTGAAMPDGTPGTQGGVLLLIGEDSVSKTLHLRLQAAGANMERVGVLDDEVSFPEGLQVVRQAAVQMSAKLIVIDPLSVFLGRNSNGDQAVRQALTPLRQFAEQSNAAVVIIRHLNKSGGRRAMYRGSGSIGIVAAVRSAFLVAKHPDDPNMRVLAQTKSNLGPISNSLLFEPVSTDDGAVKIEWRGPCDLTADDLLVPSKDAGSKFDEAQQFLLEMLASGPVEQAVIQQHAAERVIAYRTVERAKGLLNVVSRREGFGPGSRMFWELPTGEPPAETAP